MPNAPSPRSPTLLLLGGHGLLGSALRPALQGLDGLGTVQAPTRHQLDLRDPGALHAALDRWQPEVVVHAAAWTAVDAAEADPAAAHALNAEVPRTLAQACAAGGRRLLHLSTDFVFDGKSPRPYRESDAPEPLSVYGASKWAGDQAVLAHCPQAVILRSGWLLGPWTPAAAGLDALLAQPGDDFGRRVLRRALAEDGLSVVADQFGAPTPAAWLAEAVRRVVQRWLAPTAQPVPAGVFHVSAAGECSRADAARGLLDQAQQAGWHLRAGPQAVRDIRTADWPAPARRPVRSTLDSSRFAEAYGLRLPDWRLGVQEVVGAIPPLFGRDGAPDSRLEAFRAGAHPPP